MQFAPRSLSDAWGSVAGHGEKGLYARYFELLMTEGLSEWLLIAYVLYALIVAAEVFFMENFFPGLKNDPTFPSLLSDISVLPGVVFGIVVTQNLNNYEAPLVAYYSFLQKVRRLAELSADAGLPELEAAIKHLVVVSDNIYRDPNVPRVIQGKVPEFFGLRSITYENLAPVTRLRQMTNYIVAYITENTPHATIVSSVVTQKDRMLDDIEGLERSSHIQAPIVSNVYIMSVAVLFFVIWGPIRMWSVLGVWHTIWFYPLALLVLTMPLIHTRWLGNVWDDARPWPTGAHEAWPKQFTDDIATVFAVTAAIDRHHNNNKQITNA